MTLGYDNKEEISIEEVVSKIIIRKKLNNIYS